jgi:hypothetical protein
MGRWLIGCVFMAAVCLAPTGPTPDQLRVTLPAARGGVRLLGIYREADGTAKFVSLRPGRGIITATTLAGSAYDADLLLDFATIAYRHPAPPAPGPCTWVGTGAFAARAGHFYICEPDANGQTFSWTRYSGGQKTW